MSIRKTRKFKEKPTILAFGHIMLPLVGILALGLLVLGVRLLFVTPGSNVTYPESSTQTMPEPEASVPDNPPSMPDETSSGQIVAVPVNDGQETVIGPTASTQTEPKAPLKAVPPAAQPVVAQKPAASIAVSSGVWVVQIGAFTTRDAAEILARDAREKKYEAFVVKAEVGGKTYFRVRIGAGAQRSDAEILASDLAAKGYPTLIARQE